METTLNMCVYVCIVDGLHSHLWLFNLTTK